MDFVDRDRLVQERQIINEYLDFLDDSLGIGFYVRRGEELLQENESRFLVNFNDIRRKFPDRASALLKNFVDEIKCLHEAVNRFLTNLNPEVARDRQFQIGLEGSFGNHHVNPRTLKAHLLSRLVCCEGIVTKCSLIRPKVVRSVHYCPATKKTLERTYTDFTTFEAFPSSNVYPTEDEDKNPLETEYGLCVYKDHQTFTIQELPETSPPGHLPRSIDIIADEDLADSCKPGDRVRVIGLYRCLPSKQNGFSSGSFRSVIIANNVQLLIKELSPTFSSSDVKNIKTLANKRNILDLLARSLAPSIWGHDEVKKAILCLLIGGDEKILHNGSRIRGDINILLIGDPSVAKSQLLRYVLHTAPRAIATTGRGSSGVGLTAAVTTDVDTGDRRLEAGAMVLADRGIVCIDEFDKMSDIDRTAIHEVMEQGRVTIAKAGIHAKLNARCAVLAAANPVFGKYDLYKTPMDNIGMQDSLLSRFDLIFVLLDKHDPIEDKSIAVHILNLHRFRARGEQDGAVLSISAAVEALSTFDFINKDDPIEVFEKNKTWCSVNSKEKLLTLRFLRKYIHMAKTIKTALTKEAAAYISESYAELRCFDTSKTDRERTMPITARQLETMIRLATAIAKARFSKTIDRQDAEKAYHLLHYACFMEKPKERIDLEERKRRKRTSGASDSDLEEIDDTDTTTVTAPDADRATRKSKRLASQITSSAATDETMEATATLPSTADVTESTAGPSGTSGTFSEPLHKRRRDAPAISVHRYKEFRKYIRKAFDDLGSPMDMVPLKTIRDLVQKKAGLMAFSDDELESAFEQLCNENIAMISNDMITLI